MAKTFGEYLKSLGIWGWLVMGMNLFTALGALELYTETRVLQNFPTWGWIVLLGVGLIVMPFRAFHKVRTQRDELEAKLDIRPSIRVQPIREDNIFYLKVCNNGAEAKFKAQITLSSKDDPQVWRLTTYDGYWQMANGNESKILPNQYDNIKIAERVSSPPDFNSVHLRIIYYNPKLTEALYSSGGEAHCDTSSYWIGGYIEKEDGSKTPLEKKEYDLHVSISSSPSLREKIYIENFKLDIDSLRISHPF